MAAARTRSREGSAQSPNGRARRLTLPPSLMAAAAAFGEARISLIVGAGCSSESPTDLPMSRELSRRAHAQLIDDGVLAEGDCANPDDLSVLADAVAAKTGGQAELVMRMEPNRLQNAPPNEGYRCAVALMLEDIIRSIVTLNFDLSLNHALAEVGASDRVSTLRGPEQWPRMAARSIVYLHRNVEADPEELVLRSTQLNDDWRDGWQHISATAAISTPVCVFVGLGTPAEVLVASTNLVRTALSAHSIYLVGPGAREGSEFASRLGIDSAHYIQSGWGWFMLALSARTMREHARQLAEAATRIATTNETPAEDLGPCVDRLLGAGIVRVGKARGRWIHQKSEYVPLADAATTELVADLLSAVAAIERLTSSQISLDAEGVLEFRSGGRILGRVALASGRGVLSAEGLVTIVRQGLAVPTGVNPAPSVVVLGHVTSALTPVSPPADIVGGVSEGDITVASTEPTFITIADLNADLVAVVNAWSAV